MSAIAAVHSGHLSIEELRPQVEKLILALADCETDVCRIIDLVGKSPDNRLETPVQIPGAGELLVRVTGAELLMAKRRELDGLMKLFADVLDQLDSAANRLRDHRLPGEAARLGSPAVREVA